MSNAQNKRLMINAKAYNRLSPAKASKVTLGKFWEKNGNHLQSHQDPHQKGWIVFDEGQYFWLSDEKFKETYR